MRFPLGFIIESVPMTCNPRYRHAAHPGLGWRKTADPSISGYIGVAFSEGCRRVMRFAGPSAAPDSGGRPMAILAAALFVGTLSLLGACSSHRGTWTKEGATEASTRQDMRE